jgi:hypothetical protein
MRTKDGLKKIAAALEGRERFVLQWMAKNSCTYGEVSGATFDELRKKGLVEAKETIRMPRYWMAGCTPLGREVAEVLNGARGHG